MHGCRLIPTMCPASVYPCVAAYTHTNCRVCVRELHVSDKHTPRRMHRRCPLRSGPLPPGNNSKSRVINPSAVSSFPTSLRPSLCPLARWVYTCVWMLVRGLLPFTCSSLSVANQFLPCMSVRTRAKMGMQFLSARLSSEWNIRV